MERFIIQQEPDPGVLACSDRRAGLEPIFIHETRTGNHCFRAEPRLNLIFSNGSGFNFFEKFGGSGSGLSYLFRIETTLAQYCLVHIKINKMSLGTKICTKMLRFFNIHRSTVTNSTNYFYFCSTNFKIYPF